MTIDEYNKLFPDERVWCMKNLGVYAQGMILFDEETACCWGGPFEGGYAYYKIKDNTGVAYLKSEAQTKLEFRFRKFHPFGGPAADEAHLQKRLNGLPPRQRGIWEADTLRFKPDHSTIEKPITLYISGNDDTSYSKFFSSIAEAETELELMLATQPCNMSEHIIDNGFVFTN